MKSLDQIYDAVSSSPANAGRTAIRASDLPLTIDQPGSYYLAESITFGGNDNGILISSSDVTLDLNGFALIGAGKDTPTSGSMAVRLEGSPSRVTVQNGTVRDWPSAGVAWSSSVPTYCTVRNLQVFDVGGPAISLGSGATVEDCLVVGAGNSGLHLSDRAVVRRTIVRSSGSSVSTNAFNLGANCVVEDSQALNNTGRGFACNTQSRFENCVASTNGSNGFHVDGATDTQYLNCLAVSNTGSGIVASWRSRVINCTARANQEHGIQIVGTSPQGMRIEDCLVSGNSLDGLSAVGSFRGSVLNSHFTLNGNDGIDVGAGWFVLDNQCNANGTAASFTTGAAVRTAGSSVVRGNVCQFNDIGIACSDATSYFAANQLTGNTTAKSLSGSTEGTGDLANVSF